MSNAHTSSGHGEPSDRKILYSAVGWIGVIVIIVLVFTIAYIYTREPSAEARHEEERFRIRNEVRGEQARRMASYAWEDRQAGVVRLAVDDHLFRITLEELRETNEEKLAANAE